MAARPFPAVFPPLARRLLSFSHPWPRGGTPAATGPSPPPPPVFEARLVARAGRCPWLATGTPSPRCPDPWRERHQPSNGSPAIRCPRRADNALSPTRRAFGRAVNRRYREPPLFAGRRPGKGFRLPRRPTLLSHVQRDHHHTNPRRGLYVIASTATGATPSLPVEPAGLNSMFGPFQAPHPHAARAAQATPSPRAAARDARQPRARSSPRARNVTVGQPLRNPPRPVILPAGLQKIVAFDSPPDRAPAGVAPQLRFTTTSLGRGHPNDLVLDQWPGGDLFDA